LKAIDGLGGAHAPQSRHEDVLRDVLGAAVVVDHAVDVGPDPPLIAVVELLEGMRHRPARTAATNVSSAVSDAARGAAGATASVAMVPYSLTSGARHPPGVRDVLRTITFI
jgi:hypothetical protein